MGYTLWWQKRHEYNKECWLELDGWFCNPWGCMGCAAAPPRIGKDSMSPWMPLPSRTSCSSLLLLQFVPSMDDVLPR
jgi:hypothetical protein